jgi:class 3 adenylate cyclase
VSTARALLVIADIDGYTRFMRLHRLSLAHAQENTARLLEAVIDAEVRLDLVDIEGDAAFFYVREPDDEEIARSVAAVAAAMHRAFHIEQQRIAALTLCPCDACSQVGRLTLKAVAHIGDVVEQTIRTKTTIAGPDVILVHRMLKNPVPIAEYVLMTDPVYERCEARARERATALHADLEGLGPQNLWYIPLAEMGDEPPSPPRATLPRRVGMTGGQVVRAVPYLLGVKQARP